MSIDEKIINNLRRNGFNVEHFNSKEEASDYIMNFVKPGDRVGFGGSMTIKAMNLQQKVKEAGGLVLDHGVQGISFEEKLDIMRGELTSDLFLCSSNAVTEAGELINVDGNGNRIAAMIFGPKKIIIAIGKNKICCNQEAAYERLKKYASPLNNKRLNTANPCTKLGYCIECDSPSRICKAYTVLRKKPGLSDITILMIDEELGF